MKRKIISDVSHISVFAGDVGNVLVCMCTTRLRNEENAQLNKTRCVSLLKGGRAPSQAC